MRRDLRIVLASAVAWALLASGYAFVRFVERTPSLMADVVNLGHSLHVTPYRAKPFDRRLSVPYTTQTNDTTALPEGLQRVVRPGKDGALRETGLRYFLGNRLVEEKVIGREIVVKPIPSLVAVGTGKKTIIINGKAYPYKRVIDMVATAYDAGYASNGRFTGQPSQLGLPLTPGIVAVDPSVVPLGTQLYVEGYGYAIAADTGSAIQGDRIDLFMQAPPEQVRAYGIQRVKVYILDFPPVPAPNTKK